MLFSYNWLQSFFKRKLPKPKELAENLTMHAFEVEELSKKGKDWILNIDVLPNRGSDCFSHIGVAREISALCGLKLKPKQHKLKEQKKKAGELLELEVKNKNDCFRYTARVVTDVKVKDSPPDVKQRLRAVGLQPVNNIVDIANYVMLETGQPLHTFDLEKISEKKIIVRRAKKGEKITSLENKKYMLDKGVLVIADTKNPLAIAGIKGGKKAEITRSTKTVVLESANFNPKLIRSGSQKIGLRTDASWRFEHGLDLSLTEEAINQAAFLIGKIAGGKICKGLVDFYPRRPSEKRIKLDLDYVNSLIGLEISPSQVNKILQRLGFKIIEQSRRKLLVGVPGFRLDVNLPEDLIEEIGRIYGYEKIPSLFPTAALVPPEKNLNIFWTERLRDILKEAGFTEVYTTSFNNKKEIELFNYKKSKLVETHNPISAEYQFLRPSLIPNLLKVFGENQKSFSEIKIFELGKIFKKEKEKRALTGLISGDAFYQAKGVVDLLFQNIGVSDVWYDQYQPTPEESQNAIWDCERCAEIKLGSEEVGFLGEIASPIREVLKLESRAVVFDFDLEKVQNLASEEHEYRPTSPYPEAIRDIAVLVPREVLVEEVLEKIGEAGSELVRDVDLFDIYEGEEIPEGKKNLAFHIIYQAEDKTLSSSEIDNLQNKIIETLESNLGWEVRK